VLVWLPSSAPSVAASRPAWRVLKEVGHPGIELKPGGCSVSTRMEGTERYITVVALVVEAMLQRLDPHGGY